MKAKTNAIFNFRVIDEPYDNKDSRIVNLQLAISGEDLTGSSRRNGSLRSNLAAKANLQRT